MTTILIVDDEHNTRIGLVKMLCQDGYKTESVANGIEALEYLDEKTVDLVITDINMPKMNGFVFVRKLNQYYPHIKVIMMTACIEEDYDLKLADLGVFECLHKPFKMENLRTIIQKTLTQPFSLRGSNFVP
ncbi:response regulator [uncultured Desulfuromusa sp.]|uniref:response regulator n=1 Tax=uncultured Desulfuromusa sp. TaxID=219183 RepID=UPI002AA6DCA2|nr:response regulator [uncultured Desulfuromusa sp.]